MEAGDIACYTDGSSQRSFTETDNVTITNGTVANRMVVKGITNAGADIAMVRSTPTGGDYANGYLTTTQCPAVTFSATKRLTYGNYTTFRNLYITGDYDGSTNGILYNASGTDLLMDSCIIINTGTGPTVYTASDATFMNCDFLCTAGDHSEEVIVVGTRAVFRSCYIRTDGAAPSYGIECSDIAGSRLYVSKCIFPEMDDGTAIFVTGMCDRAIIDHCTFVNVADTCFHIDAQALTMVELTYNLAVNTAAGVSKFATNGWGSANHLYAKANAFYNVSTAFTDADWNGQCAESSTDRGDITLSDDPLKSIANQDYNLETGSHATSVTKADSLKDDIGALNSPGSVSGGSFGGAIVTNKRGNKLKTMILEENTTDVITYFDLVDPSTGLPETGLTIANLDATYTRDGAAAVKADLTALAAIDSAHGDNKAYEVDSTNCPGLYRVDWPDAAFQMGVDRVQLCVNGAAIAPTYIEVELIPKMQRRIKIAAGKRY